MRFTKLGWVTFGLSMSVVVFSYAQESFTGAEAASRNVIDEFFVAFNAGDNAALQRVANYPHVFLLGNGRMVVANEPSELVTDFDAMRSREGWHHSTLDSIEIAQISAEKVHFNIVFSRHTADGVRYSTVPALWIVSLVNGHWGIQVRSLMSPTFTLASRSRFFDRPIVFGAHRGGRGWRPESTLKTFQEAAEKWPDIMLESDVRVSEDGVAVLIHDATVNRTTDGSGPVTNLNLAQLQALDAGYRWTSDQGKTFPFRGQGYRISTLQEVLEALPETHFMIEFKDAAGVVQPAVRAIQDAGAVNRVIVASFSPDLMAEAEALEPDLATCFDSASRARMTDALRGNEWGSYTPEDDLMIMDFGRVENYGVTLDDFPVLRAKGIPLCVYTINTADEINRVLDLGVDSLLTDRPDILAEVLTSRGLRE